MSTHTPICRAFGVHSVLMRPVSQPILSQVPLPPVHSRRIMCDTVEIATTITDSGEHEQPTPTLRNWVSLYRHDGPVLAVQLCFPMLEIEDNCTDLVLRAAGPIQMSTKSDEAGDVGVYIADTLPGDWIIKIEAPKGEPIYLDPAFPRGARAEMALWNQHLTALQTATYRRDQAAGMDKPDADIIALYQQHVTQALNAMTAIRQSLWGKTLPPAFRAPPCPPNCGCCKGAER